MDKINITVRLDADQVAFLDQLAHNFDRDRSYLIRQAVDSYIDLHRWQIEEVKRALAEADADDFLTDEEAEAFLAELGR